METFEDDFVIWKRGSLKKPIVDDSEDETMDTARCWGKWEELEGREFRED